MSELSLEAPEPRARSRFVDDGAPFPLEGPNGRVRFVETVACAEPRCSCGVLGLVLHRGERHGAGAVMREVQRRLSLSTSTGDLRDDASGEPLEPGWLRDALTEMREPLLARFERAREQVDDPDAWRRYDWSAWRSGDRVAFHDLFPASWDLLVQMKGREYHLVDHHCVTPGCDCDDVTIDVLETQSETEDPLPVGRFSVDIGTGTASHMANRTLREVWRMARDRGLPQRIAKRQAEARRVTATREKEECMHDLPPAEDARIEALRRGDVEALPEELRALGAALLVADPDIVHEHEALAGGVGPSTIELLVLVAADPVLCQENAAGDGWASIRATRLLRELGVREHVDGEGIGRLLDALGRLDDMDILYTDLTYALSEAGEVVVEPALARLPADLESAYAYALAEILAKSGTRDDRVFDMLLRFFDEDVELGASLFTRYGDPRALPHLSAALDEVDLDDEEGYWEQTVIELAFAITRLGGELTEDQREKRDAVRERRGQRRRSRIAEREQPVVRAAPKVGRNDPCPCGSGKKYKKCHGRA